jgi:ATP-dependent RNA helicase DeaD
MFSATMPAPIQKLARQILKDPMFITTQSGKEMTNQDIEQEAYIVEEREREHALVRLLDAYKPFKSIVFCRTRSDVDQLSRTLSDSGFAAAPLHGDLEQRQRERVLGGLKEGRVQILVATDVAARGLNVSDVTHVFNYHLPHGTENYVHRIGRTGRAGNKGLALTLVTPSEFRRFKTIQSGSGTTIKAKRVPSLQDVKKTKLVEFSNILEHQPVSKDAKMLFESLGSQPSADMTLKLLSMVMGDLKVAGPERIGLDPEALKHHEERPKRDRDERRPRRKFGPPGKKRFFKGKR